jgi:hypothetical protein
MEKRLVTLSNGWNAEFINRGEFRMSSEKWSLLLTGPDLKRIGFFEKEIVLVNDFDGTQAESCIRLSDDGRHAHLTTGLEFAWVLDFQRCMFAPHRVYISHRQAENCVLVYELPAFRRTQEFVTISGKIVYITFPFCTGDDFPRAWAEYLDVRRRQLDELYFKP